MSIKKSINIALLLLFGMIIFCFSAYSQTKDSVQIIEKAKTDTTLVKSGDSKDSTTTSKKKMFSFTFEAGAGVTDKFREGMLKSPKDNISFSARMLLKMNRKLNVGVHSAYFWLKKENQKDVGDVGDKTNLKASLSAIPLVLIFNMRIIGFDVCAGLGTSRLVSSVNAFNDKVVVGSWNYVFYGSLGYTLYFTQRWGLGLEADFYSFSSIKTDAAGARLKFVYDLSKW